MQFCPDIICESTRSRAIFGQQIAGHRRKRYSSPRAQIAATINISWCQQWLRRCSLVSAKMFRNFLILRNLAKATSSRGSHHFSMTNQAGTPMVHAIMAACRYVMFGLMKVGKLESPTSIPSKRMPPKTEAVLIADWWDGNVILAPL